LEAIALEAGLADLARQALSADPEAAAQVWYGAGWGGVFTLCGW